MISIKIRWLCMMVVLMGIMFLGLTLASAPQWFGSNINYSINENDLYYHLFKDNITGFNNDVDFAIDTQNGINWTNASGLNTVGLSVVSDWINLLNSSTGNLLINATTENQTGFFVIPMQATNTTDQEGAITNFEFIINATNDAPFFTDIDSEYNLSQEQSFLDYINASDEEQMYGLSFNISFYTNCSLALWSTRTNCSIFEISNVSNTSAVLNFTPTRNDVGTYWANISVTDWGEQYSCPHQFCDAATYQQNKTTYEHVVVFNVLSSLTINASDCQDKIFQENESGTCWINITSTGEKDTLNVTSSASLRNYAGSVFNSSWFYPENVTNASNFASTIFVNATPQKREVGNWTINVSVRDITSGEIVSELVYVSVNRTLQDPVDLIPIDDLSTSVDLQTTINITVYDDDLLVPDKLEGYNETISFTRTILNQSNLSQELSLNGFDVEILNMPVAGTNRTEARIRFTPISSEAGDYTINLTVNDLDNYIDSELFNLSIILNYAPVWNQTRYYFHPVVNSSLANTSAFGPINLSEGYVNDSAGDVLTFTNDSNAMPGFSLSSVGIVSFTPYKKDVGSWNFSVTATDALGLQNSSTFSFNITNINSDPGIVTPLTPTANVSIDSNSNMNVTEDDYTVIGLFIQDDDFRIAASQKEYYNESLTINLTIQGNNPNLFNFTKTAGFPISGNNQSVYSATFTPNRTDTGDYNITINVTDASGATDSFTFNLTVNGANDAPVLGNLSNHTTAINRSFYYDINATDEEDVNESSGNLTFSYNYLSGGNLFNSSTFNSTTGEINITFNSSQGGIYHINITVNDSSNAKDYGDFWVYIYDVPNITYPSTTDNYTLQENVTTNLTFRGNHSVQDNLTYVFYVNNSLKYNTTYFGNDTNLTWAYTPDFTDETYGQNVNLTLIVYSSNPNLTNSIDLNYSANWNVNITHTNSPITFTGRIGDKQATYNNVIEINLSQYFDDPDYNDPYYNESVNFSVASSSVPSYITANISSAWILSLSSQIAVTEVLNVTGSDSTSSAVSNDFQVEFTAPEPEVVVRTVTTSVNVPVSLKILVPDPISAFQKDRIVLPLTLENDGGRNLNGINLESIVVKDELIRDDVTISFEKSYFERLNVGDIVTTEMIVDINTEDNGTFELTVNATVDSPHYMDWAKIYMTIKTNDEIVERLLFTQEFLQENPECIELEELLDDARRYFENGDFVNTVLKIQESIDGCKNAISQQARAKRRENVENPLYRYLLIATLFVFFMGFAYYSYKRMKLRKSSVAYSADQQRNQNLFKKGPGITAIVVAGGILFFTMRNSITGFVVESASYVNEFKFSFAFIFIIAVFGFFIWIKGKQVVKLFKESRGDDINSALKIKIGKEDFDKNEMRGLIGKEVYTDGGDYIGKVQEVVLNENKIGKLMIKLYSEKGFWTKGIIIDYSHVRNVGNIVIIKRRVLEKLLEKDGE